MSTFAPKALLLANLVKTILPKLLTALQLPLGGSITSNNVASDFSSTPEKAPIIAIEVPPPFCHNAVRCVG